MNKPPKYLWIFVEYIKNFHNICWKEIFKKKSLRAFLFEKCYGYVIIYIHISQHTLVYDKTNWIYPISVLIWQAFFIFNEIDSKLNKEKWQNFTENLKNMQTCLCFRTEQKKCSELNFILFKFVKSTYHHA